MALSGPEIAQKTDEAVPAKRWKEKRREKKKKKQKKKKKKKKNKKKKKKKNPLFFSFHFFILAINHLENQLKYLGAHPYLQELCQYHGQRLKADLRQYRWESLRFLLKAWLVPE